MQKNGGEEAKKKTTNDFETLGSKCVRQPSQSNRFVKTAHDVSKP